MARQAPPSNHLAPSVIRKNRIRNPRRRHGFSTHQPLLGHSRMDHQHASDFTSPPSILRRSRCRTAPHHESLTSIAKNGPRAIARPSVRVAPPAVSFVAQRRRGQPPTRHSTYSNPSHPDEPLGTIPGDLSEITLPIILRLRELTSPPSSAETDGSSARGSSVISAR